MILFRYILKDYFKYVVFTILLTVFLFILFDFIHKSSGYFAKFQPKTEYILQYYLYQMPAQIQQGLPLASLLSSVLTMVLLARSNEITAMRAAGMSPWSIAAPLGIGGFILSLFAYGVGELLLPKAALQSHHVTDHLIEGKPLEDGLQALKWFRHGETFIHFSDYDPTSREVKNVEVLRLGNQFHLETLIHAKVAKPDRVQGVWQLDGNTMTDFLPTGQINKIVEVGTIKSELPFEQQIKKESRQPSELSIRELLKQIEGGRRLGADVRAFEVDLHIKIAYPLAAFVVSLIGLNFGYRSERNMETVRSVIIAFLIGASYWFLLSAGRALSRRGDLDPMIGAWLANLVLFLVSIALVNRAKKI